MRFIQALLELLFVKKEPPQPLKDVELPNCEHQKSSEPFDLVIKGKEMKGFRSDAYCRDCLQKFLEEYSTVCAQCKEPILPGKNVARAWVGAPHPYTCLGWDCCDSGAFYCGMWGKGRLITLHELDPVKYPTPGEITPMDMLVASPEDAAVYCNDLSKPIPDIQKIRSPLNQKMDDEAAGRTV